MHISIGEKYQSMFGISLHRSFLVRSLVFAMTHLFSYFSPASRLTTSRLCFQSSRSWEQMSHLHTQRFVFWKCEDAGQRKRSLLAVEPAFPKLFSFFKNMKLQTAAPWCVQAFVMDTNSNMDVNTDSFLQTEAVYAVPALFPGKPCTVVGFFPFFLSLL